MCLGLASLPLVGLPGSGFVALALGTLVCFGTGGAGAGGSCFSSRLRWEMLRTISSFPSFGSISTKRNLSSFLSVPPWGRSWSSFSSSLG